MKKNTQKLLLALYSKTGELKNRVALQNLQSVVEDLTDGGYRSLIHVLKKQGLITTQRFLGNTTVSITHHGSVLLESEFPALSSKWDEWDGKWDCLVFIDSPSFDKQFRYLRKILLSEGALAVSRGVYISPGGFSEVVLQECHQSYNQHLIIFSVGEWKVAAEASFIIEKYGLLDLAETYSGISRDVDRLLKSTYNKKRLIDKDKKDIYLVYDRMVSILLEDPGFCTFYFREVEKVKSILLRLNTILSL